MKATSCTFRDCRRTTRDPSARCHDHRAFGVAATAPVTVPRPPAPGWVSGIGLRHPVGGYDEHRTGEIGDSYFLGGMRHREDGPARVVVGSVSRLETYYVYGEIHREDGPAVSRFDQAGVLREETYYRHGAVYREEGPTTIFHDHDGEIGRESWEPGGELHRLDGPALITYSGGRVLTAEHWLHGEFVSEATFARLREALDGGAPYEWARAFAEGGNP